jgi:predicted transcriptional regulator
MSTTTFSMRMNADTKLRLEESARRKDRSAAYLANIAIENFLRREAAEREAVAEALSEADKGVFVSGEAVDRWMQRWADGHDEPFPEPDIFPESKSAPSA